MPYLHVAPVTRGEATMPQHRHLEPSHDLRELVYSVLARNPHLIGDRLRVEFERGSITLRGAVRSWYHKQVAQESIRRIEGVDAIRNELEVVGG
jgi:osmotically-inducible protein OsmY